jgi:hypothetical protein
MQQSECKQTSAQESFLTPTSLHIHKPGKKAASQMTQHNSGSAAANPGSGYRQQSPIFGNAGAWPKL